MTARYLNVNGVIQSGVQTITLNVDHDFVANTTTSFLDNQGAPLPGISFGDDQVPVNGYFDAINGAIVVEDIVPEGGRIILAGQILSTGHGLLRAAYGPTSVSITNDSQYQTILNRIDTTKERVGKITIVDTSLPTQPQKTEYEVTAAGIKETKYTGTLGGTVAANDGVVSSINYGDPVITTHDLPATDIVYTVQPGTTYVWVEGQEKTSVEVTVYEENSFNVVGDNEVADLLAKDDSYLYRTVNFRDEQPLLESEATERGTNGLFDQCA